MAITQWVADAAAKIARFKAKKAATGWMSASRQAIQDRASKTSVPWAAVAPVKKAIAKKVAPKVDTSKFNSSNASVVAPMSIGSAPMSKPMSSQGISSPTKQIADYYKANPAKKQTLWQKITGKDVKFWNKKPDAVKPAKEVKYWNMPPKWPTGGYVWQSQR